MEQELEKLQKNAVENEQLAKRHLKSHRFLEYTVILAMVFSLVSLIMSATLYFSQN